jgi:TRAP-type C4-dicarboxylate transport system substrate-binding protein
MNDRQLRNLQKTRHMADINRMILANPLFRNLSERDQKKLAKLVYKAETVEMYVRERDIYRVNQSFDQIVNAVGLVLNEIMEDEEEDKRRREEGE